MALGRRKVLEAQPGGSSYPSPSSGAYTITWSQATDLTPAHQTSPSQSSRTSPIIPYLSCPGQIPNIFPLPLDHLITLVQYNVLRATLTNMSIMSLLQCIPVECGGAYGVPPMDPPPFLSIPPSLAPTPLQRSTPHELWIDILPMGAFRDNLILATTHGSIDVDEFCGDMVGGLFEGYKDLELKGVLCWSDPWCADGWEVTEGFLKKWGFLIKGCQELMDATNRWRALRNEEPLVWSFD